MRHIIVGMMMVFLSGLSVPAGATNDDAVAVVIGNKNYAGDRIPNVEFAHNDAEAFKRFLIDVMGYRDGNIIDLRDATQAQMTAAFGNRETHEGTLWQYLRPGRSNVTVFYSGHGVPGLKDRRGYLLPVDANAERPEINGYSVDVLYENLSKLKAKAITVYLDACFSGDSSGGILLSNASGVTVRAKLPAHTKELVVVTAAQGDQVASWDEKNHHGIFTHHLLEALYGKADGNRYGNGDGEVSVNEVKAYLDDEMTYSARRYYGRNQTATVLGDKTRVLASYPPGAILSRPKIHRPDMVRVPKANAPVAPLITQKRFITIGTGGVRGVYFPTGGAICRLVNKGRERHNIRCSAESTGGSNYNLSAIRKGEMDLGIAQSDWHFHAYQGTSIYGNAGANKELRAIFAIYPEPLTVVARADAGIAKLADLKGKRVNVGNPGSGPRGIMEVLMSALGWTGDDFAPASELNLREQTKALCKNKVDAIVFTVGHPSSWVKNATMACDTVLVNVTGPKVENLIRDHTYFRKATIPGGMYRGTNKDITTFGVGATLMSSIGVSEDVIYEVVRSVFENLEQFKHLHPSFANLRKDQMVRDSLSAPLHPGAVKYFTEAGIY